MHRTTKLLSALQIFKVTKEGTRTKESVAGCFCDMGMLQDNAMFRIFRHTNRPSNSSLKWKEAGETEEKAELDEDDDVEESAYTVIYEGPCSSMFHKKDRVTSIKKNFECGLQFVDHEGNVLELMPGDRIECYEEIQFQPEANIEFDFE